MVELLSKLSSLPGPFRIGGVVGIGVVILGIVYIAAPQFLPVAFVALLLAGLAFALYRVILKAMDKRKSKPF